MADMTVDDILEALRASVRPFNENSNAPPLPRPDINPTKAFDRPAPRPGVTVDDMIATVKGMRKGIDSDSGPARAPLDINRTTKGEIEAAKGKADEKDAATPSAVQAWLAKYLPVLTGPARAIGGAAAMPLDVGADLLRRGVHGAFGLEEQEPYKYSGERAAQIMGALGDTAEPFQAGTDAVRKALVASGARPNSPSGATPPNPAARRVVEGVPATAPVPSMPASPAPRVAASTATQGGAFAEPSTTTRTVAGPSMPPAQAPGPPTQEGAFEQPPATRSLSEEFRKRSAEIDRDPKGDLSEDQKKQLELNFFLGMLAKSSQRGARALGAFGESGLDVSKEATSLQDKNFTRGRDRIQQQRQDLATEMGFGDKDIDNTRADRRERAEEKRWQATDKKDTERVAILREQMEQGNWSAVNNGKTGTVHLLNKKTGETKDTGVKIDRGDTRSAEEKLIDRAKSDPAFLETLLAVKGKDEDKSAAREKEIIANATKLSGDSMGKISFADAFKQITEALPSRSGGAPAALPAGLPEGSKQVGTANGKPVYESPDGKRFTVK